jgi:hypothetical protein
MVATVTPDENGYRHGRIQRSQLGSAPSSRDEQPVYADYYILGADLSGRGA